MACKLLSGVVNRIPLYPSIGGLIVEKQQRNDISIIYLFVEKALKVKKHIEKIQKLEQENESSNFLIHLKKIFLVTPQSVFISSPKYAIRLKANYLNLEILKCSKRRIAKLVNLSDKNVQQTPVIYLTHQAAGFFYLFLMGF